MADYFAIECYISNSDFSPDSNVELWRTRTKGGEGYSDGKWRFMLYDTDLSAGRYSKEETSADYDSIKANMKKHPLFAAAMKNEQFREQFRDSLNTAAKKVSPLRTSITLSRYDRKYRSLISESLLWMGEDLEKDGNGNAVSGMAIYDRTIKHARNFFKARKKELKRLHPELF